MRGFFKTTEEIFTDESIAIKCDAPKENNNSLLGNPDDFGNTDNLIEHSIGVGFLVPKSASKEFEIHLP